MTREEIVELLEVKHQELFNWLQQQPDENWEVSPPNKWTTGQHISHLVKSILLLNKALSYPRFLLKYKFGTANRPSRSYQEVTQRYEERLAKNRERARVFNQTITVPKLKQKKQLIDSLHIFNKKLQYKTSKLKEHHLDTLILPHPLMGKMTLREIIMWTAHHTEHHKNVLQLHNQFEKNTL